MFCKIIALTNFAKFTKKHLCQSSFFNNITLRPATLLKKRPWHRGFPMNFKKFLKTTISIEHLWWLVLFLEKRFFSHFHKIFQNFHQYLRNNILKEHLRMKTYFSLCTSPFVFVWHGYRPVIAGYYTFKPRIHSY